MASPSAAHGDVYKDLTEGSEKENQAAFNTIKKKGRKSVHLGKVLEEVSE